MPIIVPWAGIAGRILTEADSVADPKMSSSPIEGNIGGMATHVVTVELIPPELHNTQTRDDGSGPQKG